MWVQFVFKKCTNLFNFCANLEQKYQQIMGLPPTPFPAGRQQKRYRFLKTKLLPQSALRPTRRMLQLITSSKLFLLHRATEISQKDKRKLFAVTHVPANLSRKLINSLCRGVFCVLTVSDMECRKCWARNMTSNEVKFL